MSQAAVSRATSLDPHILVVETASVAGLVWNQIAGSLTAAGYRVLRITPAQAGTPGALAAYLGSLVARPAILCAGSSVPAVIPELGDKPARRVTALMVMNRNETGPAFPDNLPVLSFEADPSGNLICEGGDLPQPFNEGSGGRAIRQLPARFAKFLATHLCSVPSEYAAGADARVLRDAFGCFATGVTVVTAVSPAGTPVGFTANSFTSVSLDPPLLLVCIARSATSADAFSAGSHFAINVLHMGQQDVSACFARKGEDRFSRVAWQPGLAGSPLLPGALATFECRRHQVHDGGDHLILVGAVERARFEPHRDPLIYFRGQYRRLELS